MKLVVYDCEIRHCIPDGKNPIPKGMATCKGWTDYTGMGISVITAYVWGEGYRVFLENNMQEFKALASDPETILAGFHSWRFDDRLIAAVLDIGINPSRTWDLLRQIVKATGGNPDGVPHGYGLSALCEANFLSRKTPGAGAQAPILWQSGQIGALVDYCLSDTMRTKKLIELAVDGRLRSPIHFRRLDIDCSAIAHLVPR